MKTKILRWQFMWAVLATAVLAGALVAQQQEPQQPPPAAAPQAQPARTDGDAPATKPRAAKIVLPAGTRLPLVLHNAITTRNAKPGEGSRRDPGAVKHHDPPQRLHRELLCCTDQRRDWRERIGRGGRQDQGRQ